MIKEGSYTLIEKEPVRLGDFKGSSFRFDREIYIPLFCGKKGTVTQCINLAGPSLVDLSNDIEIEPINLEITEV